jgi:hypothetical protein
MFTIEESHFDIDDGIDVISMVWQEVFLYFGFMILPLLLHLEDLLLISYLVFHFLVTVSVTYTIVGFVNQIKFLVHLVLVLWIDRRLVQVVNFGIDKSSGVGFVMDSEKSFCNTMFEKELPKYTDWLDTIFSHHPLEIINFNITSGHVFSHLQNCPISITYENTKPQSGPIYYTLFLEVHNYVVPITSHGELHEFGAKNQFPELNRHIMPFS